jgi:hypothetical protein
MKESINIIGINRKIHHGIISNEYHFAGPIYRV